MSGIVCATVLTLILAPVMYSLVDDAEVWVKRHFGREDTAPAQGGGNMDLEPGMGTARH
jgi:hypothetical protein